jgi:hypothetical protein
VIQILTRSRIRPKRRSPRRGRLKDPAYLTWCATQPCCVTREFPATTHHIRFCGSPKNDHQVIRLVERLHLHDAGPLSIERIGKDAFEVEFGIDLTHQAYCLYEQYRSYGEMSQAAELWEE